MSEINLTITESQILIMIYEGRNISDLARYHSIPVKDLNEIIRSIMDKTESTTWGELRIIGAQLSQIARGQEEEAMQFEYLANKWQHVPENER